MDNALWLFLFYPHFLDLKESHETVEETLCEMVFFKITTYFNLRRKANILHFACFLFQTKLN